MANKYNILITDDEKPARNKIKSFLKDEKNIGEIYEAENGFRAIELINKNRIDVMFLDIQMPGMKGFEILDAIELEDKPVVIFVTAYENYAVHAFEVEAVDYLLKPYDLERFSRALKKGIEKTRNRNLEKIDYSEIIKKLNEGKSFVDRIIVNKSSKYFFVKTIDLYFISSNEKYVELNTENEKFLLRNTMNNMELKLNPEKFKRVHRSYIVNMDYIKEILPCSHGDYTITLTNGKNIKLARSYNSNIFKK